MTESSPTGRGSATGRSRRSQLTRERIVAAALAVVERAPREPLTLAAVATELGVATMSLYTHFRNREELLEVLREAALAKFRFDLREEDPWEKQLADLLRAQREHTLGYPFLALEPLERPIVSPVMLTPLVAVLRRTGLQGADLAECARWLARAFGSLTMLDQVWPIDEATRRKSWPTNPFSPDELEVLREVLPFLSSGTAEEAFSFATGRAVAAVRDLVRSAGARGAASAPPGRELGGVKPREAGE